MIEGIVYLAVGATIGAIVSMITRRSAEPYFIIDVLAGSSGALVAGLLLALPFGLYNNVPPYAHLLNFPTLVGAIVGALFCIELANLLFDATHHENR